MTSGIDRSSGDWSKTTIAACDRLEFTKLDGTGTISCREHKFRVVFFFEAGADTASIRCSLGSKHMQTIADQES